MVRHVSTFGSRLLTCAVLRYVGLLPRKLPFEGVLWKVLGATTLANTIICSFVCSFAPIPIPFFRVPTMQLLQLPTFPFTPTRCPSSRRFTMLVRSKPHTPLYLLLLCLNEYFDMTLGYSRTHTTVSV